MRFEGASVRRAPQRFASGWIAIAELSADAASVETSFAESANVIAIIIDGPGTPSDADQLGIGVSSARIVSAQPVAVVAGERTTLFFEVASEGAFTVTVAPPSPWRLAGVLAASQPLEIVASEVAERGVDGVLAPPAANESGRWRIAWKDGAGVLAPHPTDTGHGPVDHL